MSCSRVVTTSLEPKPQQIERARQVAFRIGGVYRPRRGALEPLFSAGAELIYVITKQREELRARDGSLFVNEGMIKLKRADGPAHPMLRALAPPEGPPVERILDATIGLASDAVHVSWVLERPVIGVEASPIIHCLLEEGLPRMGRQSDRWRAVTERISVRCARAVDVLEELADDSEPVVYFDPMFDSPLHAAPGFPLLRRVACKDRLDEVTLAEAVRVARDRVVVKVPHGGRPTAEVNHSFNRRICGKAVDYVVIEKALASPVWEHRNLPGDHH